MSLTSLHHRLLAELTRDPQRSAESLAQAMDLSTSVTACFLEDLIEAGHVTPKVELALSYQPVERIGRCPWCGLVSHHLIAGECPECRARVQRYTPRAVIRRARHG